MRTCRGTCVFGKVTELMSCRREGVGDSAGVAWERSRDFFTLPAVVASVSASWRRIAWPFDEPANVWWPLSTVFTIASWHFRWKAHLPRTCKGTTFWSQSDCLSAMLAVKASSLLIILGHGPCISPCATMANPSWPGVVLSHDVGERFGRQSRAYIKPVPLAIVACVLSSA